MRETMTTKGGPWAASHPSSADTGADRWVWVPFEVEKRFDGMRIDRFLSQRLSAYSRNKVQRILADSRVLKGDRTAKPHTRVRTGDKIQIAYPRRPEVPPPAETTVPVLYEDEQLIVVNKPANVLSHPTDKIVLNTVLALLRRDRPGDPKLHLLHRLDRETSGVLALAKEPQAARAWTRAMSRHEIRKEYLTLVRGHLRPTEGTIDSPIGRDASAIKVRQWVNVPDAVPASTTYRVEQYFAAPLSASLVRAYPKTGRLHQIRVHFAALGHPVLGDPLYTGEGEVYSKMVNGTVQFADRLALGFPRVALHAAAMTFRHPCRDELIRVEAPLPHDLVSWTAESHLLQF